MNSSLNNPWFNMVFVQMWIVRQASESIAHCIDPDLVLDPLALANHSLDSRSPRLNPLEFHGKRRVSGRRQGVI